MNGLLRFRERDRPVRLADTVGAPGGPSRRVWLVVALVMIGVVGLSLAAVVLSAMEQNRVARSLSRQTVQALVGKAQRSLGQVAKDYSHWREAVDSLAPAVDAEWAEANIGTNLVSDFSVDHSVVIDGGDRVVFAMESGELLPEDRWPVVPAGILALVRQVRASTLKAPAAATGLVAVDGGVRMAAAGLLTADGARPDSLASHAVLVLARNVDTAFLTEIGGDFGFNDLSLEAAPPAGGRNVLPLIGVDGTTLGWLAWRPHLPGSEFLGRVLPALLGLYLVVVGLCLVFLRQLRAASEAVVVKNEALTEAYAQARAIGDAAPVPLVVLTLDDGIVQYANAEAERATGGGERALSGHPAERLFKVSENFTVLLEVVREEGLLVDHEAILQRADGTVFSAQIAASAMVHRGRPAVTLGFHDISQRQQMLHSLLEAKDAAEAASRAKSAFLANISHELRTPLNAIIGFADIIARQEYGPAGPPEYADFAQDIHDSGTHLLAIINDILDMAKIEAGAEKLQETEVDVADIVRSCLRVVQPTAAAGDLTCEEVISPPRIRLRADPRRFKQILINLLSNATKFTPPGGTVRVVSEIADNGWLVVRVSDTGIGIDEADIPTVLQPFGQVQTALSKRHYGTGLGLPLVLSLVRTHQGRFELSSRPGIGTTATVRFPPERLLPVRPPMADTVSP